MDKEQLIKDLEYAKLLSDQIDYLLEIGFDLEAKTVEPFCRIMDQYVNLLTRLYNDTGNWIKWFIFENDFGKGLLEVEIKEDSILKYRIKDIKEFVEFWDKNLYEDS